jgi:heavy metal translocating P-type ATPase
VKHKTTLRTLWFSVLIAALILLSVLIDTILKIALPVPFAVLPLVLAGGYVIYTTWDAMLSARKITAGMLVVLALIGTTWVREYLSGAIVAFMMIFGESLEGLTTERTKNAVRDLIRLVPATCRKLVEGVFQEASIKTVRPGDIIQIIPGGRIPVDGVITKGQISINEASITGESMPADKGEGEMVYVGTFVENGVGEIRTEKIGNSTVLGRIIKTVHTAQENKGHYQKLADIYAAYFLPVIMAVCLLTGIVTRDIMRIMTILVIACPCALILATPTAVIASVGNAAKKGVVLKGGDAIEKLAKVTTICLDKTGTLTKGKPAVVAVMFCGEEAEMLETLGIAEKNSQHPIAKAVLQYLKTDKNMDTDSLPDGAFEMLLGRGVQVVHEETLYEVSNWKCMEDMSEPSPDLISFLYEQEGFGRTVMIVSKNRKPLGVISVADTLRDGAFETIHRLKKMGISKIIMLTGDNESTARAICEEAGIDEFHANLLPDEKLNYLQELKKQGEKIAMVGDGVNDAPALALADVGIAMGGAGTEVAIETADIALMSDNINALPFTYALSKQTYRIIGQNIFVFACVVNVLGVTFSSLGFLNPVIGAIIHNASSVFVVLNSAKMLTWGKKLENR